MRESLHKFSLSNLTDRCLGTLLIWICFFFLYSRKLSHLPVTSLTLIITCYLTERC